MAGPKKYNIPVSVPELRIQRGSQDRYNGLTVKKLASAVFDTAGTDSAGVANTTIAAHGLGVYLPDNAIVTNVWYDVVTTFTSATDAATLALKIQTANDLVSALAISDASNIWDSGQHGTLTAGSTTLTEAVPNTRTAIVKAADDVAGFIKLTAERELTITVAVEVLTAGKLVVFAEYVQSV